MHRFGCSLWHRHSPHLRKVCPGAIGEEHCTPAHSGTDTPGYPKCFPYSSLLALPAATLTPHCNLSVRPAQSQPTAAVCVSQVHIHFCQLHREFVKCFCTFMTCWMARSPSQIGIADPDTPTQPFSHFSSLSPSASPPSERTSTSIIPPTRVNDSLF